MFIAKVENNIVSEVGDHRAMFPNYSFPANGPSDEFLAEQNCVKVNLWRDHDSKTQKLVACEPVYEAPWVYVVKVEDKTPEDVAIADEAKASDVRAQRNKLLDATDWTQVADSPVSQLNWANYRQALRDIPQQSGFPWNVVWPAKPE